MIKITKPEPPEWDAQFLALHAGPSPDLLAFALNPNCPAMIRTEILRSDDDLARRCVEITDGWRRNGTLLCGSVGRWKRPYMKRSRAAVIDFPPAKAR